MELPKINFIDYAEDQDMQGQRKSTSEHKVLFAKLIDVLTEENPHLKSCQVKAMAIEKFLSAADMNVICIETYEGTDYGTALYNKQTREKIGFIRTNALVVNALQDLYMQGVFEGCEKVV